MDGCVQVVQVVVHLSLVHLILGLIHDVVILHSCSFGNLKSMFSVSSSLVPPF